MTGHFAAYTFITPILTPTGERVPGGVPAVLLLFGLASTVGVALVGRVPVERTRAVLGRVAFVVVAALATTALLGRNPAADLALVVVWAGVTSAVPALTQTLMLTLGGPELRTTVGAMLPATFNLGIAVGAAVGSAAVDAVGLAWLPLPAALVAGLGAVGLLVTRPTRGGVLGR